MQFLRRLPCQRFFSTQPVKTKIPRYTKQAEEIMSDTMIPGPYLRYFKTKKEKKKHDDQNPGFDQVYTTPARPIHYNEFDSAPTITQERFAERLHRAVTTMYTMETLPNQWITPTQLKIKGVKVSRNLRKCQVLYEPLSLVKKERGQVHRSLSQYTPLLSMLIKSHAQLKHPLSIKFVPDTQAKELEAIFDEIAKEQN